MRRNRRQELVEATFRRVAQEGFEGFRLRDVSDDVGIDHSSAYHYIKTRQDLVLEVTHMVTRRLSLTMPRNGNPEERLSGHFDALMQLFVDDPETLIVSAEIDLRARRDPAVAEALEHAEASWRAALADIFRQGTEEGLWGDLNVDSEVETVIAVIKGVRLRPDLAPAVLGRIRHVIRQA